MTNSHSMLSSSHSHAQSQQQSSYKNKSQNNHTKTNLNVNIPSSSSHSGASNSSYPDLVTTNSSYYSPQSQLSQSFGGSLSPLSINSNSLQSVASNTQRHNNNGNHGSNHGHNNNNNNHYSFPYKVPISSQKQHKCFHGYHNYRKYHFIDKQSAKFSLQVFVAMHTTRQLAWYALHEPWGDKNSLLFKYLDYTFRCAAFRDQIYTFQEKQCHHNNHNHHNNHHNHHHKSDSSFPSIIDDEREDNYTPSPLSSQNNDQMTSDNRCEWRLVFNTGLVARPSGKTIYLLLTPNQKKSVAQAWRVGYGDPYNRYNSSFITDDWLLNNVIPNKNKNLLPKQFKLNTDLFLKIRDKFGKNKLKIEADFDHIVTKYWDRIIGEYNKRSSLRTPTKEETTKLLRSSFERVLRNKKKHDLLTPMLYVDSHNAQHSVEYMVPLPIDVPIRGSGVRPHRNNNSRKNTERIWFAAALVSRDRVHAQLMSILSADMAYSNARLINCVKTQWLKKLAPFYHKLEVSLANKMSPALKIYRIQQNSDNVEKYLSEQFSKYGKIVNISLSLVSSRNENDTKPSNQFSAVITFARSNSVIEAYNGCMDRLNRRERLGFELDFELLKEADDRQRTAMIGSNNDRTNNNNKNNSNAMGNNCINSLNYNVYSRNNGGHSGGGYNGNGMYYGGEISRSSYRNNCNSCSFSMLFSQPHILPPPEQLFSSHFLDNNGPFYPSNQMLANHIHTTAGNRNNQNNGNNNHHYYNNKYSMSPSTPKHFNYNNNNRGYHNNNNNGYYDSYYGTNNGNNHKNGKRFGSSNMKNEAIESKNYYQVFPDDGEWNDINDSLRSYGVDTDSITQIKQFNQSGNGNKMNLSESDMRNNVNSSKTTTDTTLWYMTSPNLAAQIANNGFIFKFMTDFSKLMDTSGFKFESNPIISNKNMNNNHDEIHLFQCKLKLTDKQVGYLRHNGNIIITDTRIISPQSWIILSKPPK